MIPSNLTSQFANNTRVLTVQKDRELRFIDCNDTWLHYGGLKNKDQALGLTDRDMVWGPPFIDILETYENNILKGQAYPLINPALVEDHRFCWLQNYKWPR